MQSLASNISVSGTSHLFMLISNISANYTYKSTSADAISEVIDEIFLQQKIPFNIETSKDSKLNMDMILTKLAKNNRGNFSYKIYRNDLRREKKPTVFLTQDISELDSVHDYIRHFVSKTNYSTSLRYLIYCEELNLKNYKTTIRPFMSFNKNNWAEYVNNYYAIDSSENVTLLTYFVRENPRDVGVPYILRLETAATFDKKSWTWIGGLKKLKKKWNYEYLKGMAIFSYLYNGTNYDTYTNEVTGKFSGVLVDIIKVVGQKYQMNMVFMNLAVQRHTSGTEGDGVPSISVWTDYKYKYVIISSHLTSTYTEEIYRLVITPSDSYTSYEKLAMPFDKTTWVLLGLTFGAAFAVTVIVNKQSRWIQDIVYGKNVRMPGYNIVSIFFGIGQSKVPMSNFPRIILLLFIWFCLIFRTAYVGVLFELLALDIQRPPPQTLLELIKDSYSFIDIYDFKNGR
jgi:hypothetical protein